jgi:acyl carrier protein
MASFSGPQDDGSDHRHALTVLGKIWLAGAEIDWPAFYENECRRRVNMPTYPFERRRYWLSPRAALGKGVNETLTQPVNPDAPPERSADVNAVRSVAFRPRPTLPHPYVAAGNDLEKKIISVWRRILGVDPIGTQDNFFDLGGDSLLAIQTIEQLRKELNMEIPIVSLYESVTVKSLVEILQSTNHVHENEGHNDRSSRRKQSIDKQRTRKSKADRRR